MNMTTINESLTGKFIVTRHAGAVQWVKTNFPSFREATVLPGNVSEEEIRGSIVVGVLPMRLAAVCVYYAIEFRGDPPRGTEYSAADMEGAGARLVRYEVQNGGAYIE